MSGAIDWGRMETAEDKAAEAQANRKAAVNAECRRRIFSLVDDAAQMNLAGAAAGGLLSEVQLATYQAGLGWVAAMRARAAELVASDDDYGADEAWPEISPEVVALANAF